MDILELIKPKDLLDFSQSFSVTRNYLGDRIFPDNKTPNLNAEFYRLSDQRMLPTMALVHAFDSEAHIGTRPTAEKVKLEKMFIKEKINQSERVQLWQDNGISAVNDIVNYIFDDVARLSESVKTRTEVMKCDLLQMGSIKVKENNISFTVDYGVPSVNKIAFDWSADTADIMGDIQTMVDTAKDLGQNIDTVITTSKVLIRMRKNKGLQTAILGTNGQGTFLSLAQLNAFLQENYGFTLTTYDERYQYEKKDKTLVAKRYIDENKFIGIATLPNKTAGVGLWGVTPEEKAVAPWTEKSAKQFITSVMWNEPDPVATWTKAAGLFIPVMPNPKGLFIGTIKLTA
jgi:hypothetical protein